MRKYAPEWTPHSEAFTTTFIDQPNAGDIRVSFMIKPLQLVLVGTQSRTYSFNSRTYTIDAREKAGPSMNLAVVDRKTILHEFQRVRRSVPCSLNYFVNQDALGLHHEHQKSSWRHSNGMKRHCIKSSGPPNYWSPESRSEATSSRSIVPTRPMACTTDTHHALLIDAV